MSEENYSSAVFKSFGDAPKRAIENLAVNTALSGPAGELLQIIMAVHVGIMYVRGEGRRSELYERLGKTIDSKLDEILLK